MKIRQHRHPPRYTPRIPLQLHIFSALPQHQPRLLAADERRQQGALPIPGQRVKEIIAPGNLRDQLRQGDRVVRIV